MTIIQNAMRTPDGTILRSFHRHDYVTHEDANGKTYMLDGGLDYIRASANGDEVHLIVRLEDGHEAVRNALTWGTRGPKGDQPRKDVLLKDMDTDHIEACLKTQKSMWPQYRTAMENELKWRKL